jgi:hypothetical protein
MFQRFKKRIDPILHLCLRKISRVLNIGFYEESGDTQIFGEILPHIALSCGKEAAALYRMDHKGIGGPFLYVPVDLVVALEEITIGEVPFQHVFCNRLQGPHWIMLETELP